VPQVVVVAVKWRIWIWRSSQKEIICYPRWSRRQRAWGWAKL